MNIEKKLYKFRLHLSTKSELNNNKECACGDALTLKKVKQKHSISVFNRKLSNKEESEREDQ